MDLYTRESGKVGCIIYTTGQEKEEAAESYPDRGRHPPLAQSQGQLPTVISLSPSSLLLELLPLFCSTLL